MEAKKWKIWRALNPLYETILILFLVLFFTSMCMFILRHFKINYLYIFDIAPSTQVTRFQILALSMFLAVIGSVCVFH